MNLRPVTWKPQAGMRLRAGVASSRFGNLLFADCPAGLCLVAFCDEPVPAESILKRRHPLAKVSWEAGWARGMAAQFFNNPRWDLAIHGTPFQHLVWRELLKIPPGQTVSYSELACRIRRPEAVRATASAVARNPIAILIPCHRVIAKDGSIGNYHWGAQRKREILRWEAAG